MNPYAKIHQYLIDNPSQSLLSISKQFGVYPDAMKRNIRKIYGYDFDSRLKLIEQTKQAEHDALWPEIKAALDVETCNFVLIAQRMNIGRDVIRDLIRKNNYDIQARSIRLRRHCNATRTRKTPSVIDTHKKESIAGVMSLRAHTLPMTQWGVLAE